MSLSHRELAAAAVLLAAAAPLPLAAQMRWSGRLGATWTSTMITDQLGTPVEIGPGIAPTLGIELSFPLKTTTPLDASFEVQGTIAELYRKESGTKQSLLSMRTLAFTGGIGGKVAGPVFWRAGAGILTYLTTEEESVFQDGTPTRLLGTAAVEYRKEIANGYRLSGLLRYDLHGFTTDQLESAGYTGSQTVHRVMLGVGVGR
jgi:hypothetical protein